MKIVLFGASGKVGRIVLRELINKGHEITAFVYSQIPFEKTGEVTIIMGDIHKTEDIERALKGNEIVISTLGSWGTKTKDILSSAMANIVPIMEETGIKRIVTLTGSGARAEGDPKSFFESIGHKGFSLVANKVLSDSEEHIKILEHSKLNYTVLRSPVMNNKTNKTYELSDKVPSLTETISRDAVAAALLDLIEGGDFIRNAPFIHQK